MRSFRANQQPVFYKLLLGQEEIIDQDGNATGNFLPIFSEIKTAMLCVSPNKGSTEQNQFGTLADYDRTMTTADTACPIDENSVLWLDGMEIRGPYNAIVRRKALWKNSVQYAIKNVTVGEYQKEQESIRALNELKQRIREAEHEDFHEAE